MSKPVFWLGPNREGITCAWLATTSTMIDDYPELSEILDGLYEGEHWYMAMTDGIAVIDRENSRLAISNHEKIIFTCEVPRDWATQVASTETSKFYWVLTYHSISPQSVQTLSLDEIYEKHEEGEELFLFSVGELSDVSSTVATLPPNETDSEDE